MEPFVCATIGTGERLGFGKFQSGDTQKVNQNEEIISLEPTWPCGFQAFRSGRSYALAGDLKLQDYISRCLVESLSDLHLDLGHAILGHVFATIIFSAPCDE